MAAVMVGGALCGVAGAYISVIYTPLWVEGMVAGKGWIALALTTFATWRPARILLGAYLFGGVTMLQFHLQGEGVRDPEPVPEHAALPGHHRRAGADLAQCRPGSAPTCRPRSASPSTRVPEPIIRRFPCPLSTGESPCRIRPNARSSSWPAGRPSPPRPPSWAAARRKSLRRPRGICRRPGAAAAPKPEPLKIAFAYVGPVGDGGWTFAHDNGRKALEKEFGDKIVTSFVEKVPEAADAERVFRDMVGQGNKLIFGTTFGYMEPMLKVAADTKDVKFEHATGYKQADNMRTYDSRTYEGAYMAGVIAGAMTKSNTLGVVGSIPIPEVIRNINSFTMGAQSVNPKIKTKVVWVNEWFNPPKETEAATALINGGADVLMQNTDSCRGAEDRAGKGQARLRLGQRHDRLRPEGPPGFGHHQLGAVLHQGHARCAGRHLEGRHRCVVGPQGRRDRHGLDRR
jgi:hypothetical protein